MKVLITGANGFVGKNVCQYLNEKTDWLLTAHNYNLAEEFRLDHEEYDVFLNFASISSVERSIKDPMAVIQNNVMLTTRLLEAARAYRPKLFIQFSTVETSDITNPYAASKKAQEDICLAYARTYGIPVIVLHATNIIGPGQSPDKFVPKIIELIKAGKNVTIYTTDGKIGERIYNPVKNIAENILQLIQQGQYDRGFSTFGIEGGERLSNLQMAQLVARLLNTKLFCEFIEAKSIRPSYLMDYKVDEYKGAVWQPIQTLEEGLRELL